jgi:O-antigen/teichoic acid export membrane protein
MSAYAKGGAEAARPPLRQLGGILIALTLPAFVGLVLAGPLLVNLLVGEIYRPTALALLPLLALAFFISGLTIYPSYACKLTERTDLFLISIAIAAVANVVFSLWLIPPYGVMGAALSHLFACTIRLIALVIVARRVFALPIPDRVITLAAALGSIAMSVWLWRFYDAKDWMAACYVIPGAVTIYFGVYLLATYFGGLRLREALFTR